MKTTEDIWKEAEEIRWQMRAFPFDGHSQKTKTLFKLLDQLIDLHKREQNPELYKLKLNK